MPHLPPLPPTLDIPSEFPSLKNWHFFQHSGVSPMPKRAADAMRQYIDQSEADSYLTGGWYKHAELTRQRAAKILNADPTEIAFIKNTSEGLAFVAGGFDWKPGDEIISTHSEYPANVYPWMSAAKRFNAKHIMVPERPDGRILPEDLFAAVTPNTRMIAISHVEYASGFRTDIAAIGEFCRTHKNARGPGGKILFCVDAIQSMGTMPIDVKAMHIDFLSADGHKWMLGPEGLGIFFCNQQRLDSLRPEVGWMNVINATDYGHFDFTLRDDAKRFECGSYNLPGCFALGASLGLIIDVGIPTIWSRIYALTQMLADGVAKKGYQVFSPRAREDECSGILSFSAPDPRRHGEIIATLEKQRVIIVEREKRLRAAPHFYQGEEQINALIAALP